MSPSECAASLKWLDRLSRRMRADADRVRVIVQQMANSVADQKREGDGVVRLLQDLAMYDEKVRCRENTDSSFRHPKIC